VIYISNEAGIDAISCRVTFQTHGRLVLLTFESDGARLWARIPEHIMADIAGQFLRQRLFGLH
jgi:hypothetical protein